MPIISQPTVLPYQPTLRDKLLDAIIASAPQFAMTALTGGFNIGQIPTGKGTLQLPGGGTATPGPGLQSQLTGNQLPQLIQQGQFPQGTTYKPQTKLGIRPSIDWQTKELANQKARQALDPNSPENRILNSQAGYWDSLAKQNQQGSGDVPPDANPFANLDALRTIADKADAKDPTAMAVMDYILSQQRQ